MDRFFAYTSIYELPEPGPAGSGSATLPSGSANRSGKSKVDNKFGSRKRRFEVEVDSGAWKVEAKWEEL
jgi:hypothetical protein